MSRFRYMYLIPKEDYTNLHAMKNNYEQLIQRNGGDGIHGDVNGGQVNHIEIGDGGQVTIRPDDISAKSCDGKKSSKKVCGSDDGASSSSSSSKNNNNNGNSNRKEKFEQPDGRRDFTPMHGATAAANPATTIHNAFAPVYNDTSFSANNTKSDSDSDQKDSSTSTVLPALHPVLQRRRGSVSETFLDNSTQTPTLQTDVGVQTENQTRPSHNISSQTDPFSRDQSVQTKKNGRAISFATQTEPFLRDAVVQTRKNDRLINSSSSSQTDPFSSDAAVQSMKNDRADNSTQTLFDTAPVIPTQTAEEDEGVEVTPLANRASYSPRETNALSRILREKITSFFNNREMGRAENALREIQALGEYQKRSPKLKSSKMKRFDRLTKPYDGKLPKKSFPSDENASRRVDGVGENATRRVTVKTEKPQSVIENQKKRQSKSKVGYVTPIRGQRLENARKQTAEKQSNTRHNVQNKNRVRFIANPYWGPDKSNRSKEKKDQRRQNLSSSQTSNRDKLLLEKREGVKACETSEEEEENDKIPYNKIKGKKPLNCKKRYFYKSSIPYNKKKGKKPMNCKTRQFYKSSKNKKPKKKMEVETVFDDDDDDDDVGMISNLPKRIALSPLQTRSQRKKQKTNKLAVRYIADGDTDMVEDLTETRRRRRKRKGKNDDETDFIKKRMRDLGK